MYVNLLEICFFLLPEVPEIGLETTVMEGEGLVVTMTTCEEFPTEFLGSNLPAELLGMFWVIIFTPGKAENISCKIRYRMV